MRLIVDFASVVQSLLSSFAKSTGAHGDDGELFRHLEKITRYFDFGYDCLQHTGLRMAVRA